VGRVKNNNPQQTPNHRLGLSLTSQVWLANSLSITVCACSAGKKIFNIALEEAIF
jgi:hypothetical protein